MKVKYYDVGMVCGRFQTFHKGHESLIESAVALCDRVLILIGSSQGVEQKEIHSILILEQKC